MRERFVRRTLAPSPLAFARVFPRDRELAFYGAEDLTPSGFYSEEDARAARTDAEDLVGLIAPLV